MHSHEHESVWCLLAIGIDPDRSNPELYSLILHGEHDTPLLDGDRIVCFTDPGCASDLIRQYGGGSEADRIDVSVPLYWCDIASTLHLLESPGYDESASVLDTVNVLLELVKATGLTISCEHRAALHALADYCTLNKDLMPYFEEESDYSRRQCIDAVLWSVGAVVAKARIVSHGT